MDIIYLLTSPIYVSLFKFGRYLFTMWALSSYFVIPGTPAYSCISILLWSSIRRGSGVRSMYYEGSLLCALHSAPGGRWLWTGEDAGCLEIYHIVLNWHLIYCKASPLLFWYIFFFRNWHSASFGISV